jgi:hypothetical protein
LREPYKIVRELNAQYHRQRGPTRYNGHGTGIFDIDWDNLILLDACRFDVFAERIELLGTLSSRNTLGSRTPEVVRANFTDRQRYDLIYVSENGWYEKLKDDINAAVLKSTLLTADHFPTRHEQTTESALKLATEYPDKRLLVHYLPPHHPYYGSLAETYLPDVESQHDALFERIRKGEVDVSDDTLRDIYVENLERIVPHVETLLESLPGKTVVSADHGEYLGEWASPIPIKMYGHPPTTYTQELTRVPWHVHESGDRKTIRAADSGVTDKEEIDADLDDHLSHLGYKMS